LKWIFNLGLNVQCLGKSGIGISLGSNNLS